MRSSLPTLDEFAPQFRSLVRAQKSLIQVCLDCGFSDQSYFTKVFQKYTGHTPGGYRRSDGPNGR